MKRSIISVVFCLTVAAAFAADIPVVVSHVEWRETFKPTLSFALRRIPAESARLAVLGPSGLPGMATPRLKTWTVQAVNSLPYAGSLSIAALPPGDYVLESWIGEGDFSADRPYGFAKFSASAGDIDRVAIELTEVNASMPRIDIVSALKLQDVYAKIAEPTEADSASLYNEVVDSCTDRGYWAPDQLAPSAHIGLDTRDASTADIKNVRVRILRSAVNGEVSWNGVRVDSSDPVLDTVLPVGEHDIITEADLFSATSDADLDWGAVRDICVSNQTILSWGNISNITYRVVLFDGTVDRDEENNNLSLVFVNRFEPGLRYTQVTNMEVYAWCGQPTFSWTHENTIGKAYPAFRLRVWEEDGTTCVFDSGVRRAPARDAAGRYSWTPPADIALEPETTYLWSVSMLDAKFTSPYGEVQAAFVLQEAPPVSSPDPLARDKIVPFVVNEVDWRGLPQPEHLKFRLRKIAGSELLPLAPAWYAARPEVFGKVDLSWTHPVVWGLPFANMLINTDPIPQGDYMLECWRGDSDEYEVGEPYGCVRFPILATGDIERVSIELAEVNASMPRLDLSSGAVDRNIWRFPATIADPVTNSIETAKPLTFEIWRTAVNGTDDIKGVPMASDEPVLSATLPIGAHVVTEADFFAASNDAADLDWGAVRNICIEHKNVLSWGNISNITYRVDLFDGADNKISAVFVNRFEPGLRYTQVTNMEVRVFCGRPTFSWMHPNPIGKAYPAFQLRVWEGDGTTCVFDSGVRRAPARDAEGRYSWTPPAIVLEPNATYLWSVSMLDAKFVKPSGETQMAFSTSPDQS